MCWEVAIPSFISLGSSALARGEQRDATRAGLDALNTATGQQLDWLTESRDLSLRMSNPYREVSTAAQAAMMDMMGLPRTTTSGTGTGSAIVPYGDRGVSIGDSNFDPLLYNPSGMGSGTNPASMRWRGTTGDLYGGANGPMDDLGLAQRPVDGPAVPLWGAATPGAGSLPPGVSAPQLGDYDFYDWQTSPGYEFRFGEGMRALEASSSARAGLLSGGAMRDAIEYGQGIGSQEYQNIYNRLGVLAGYGSIGINAGANAINTASGYGSQVMGEAGASRASAYTAMGNAGARFWGDVGSTVDSLPWDDWYT